MTERATPQRKQPDGSKSAAKPTEPHNRIAPDPVVRVAPEEMSYESIKRAIYVHAGRLLAAGMKIHALRLGKDVHEILNRRLVFRSPAHRDLPYFITPFGNLRVEEVQDGGLGDDSFAIV